MATAMDGEGSMDSDGSTCSTGSLAACSTSALAVSSTGSLAVCSTGSLAASSTGSSSCYCTFSSGGGTFSPLNPSFQASKSTGNSISFGTSISSNSIIGLSRRSNSSKQHINCSSIVST
ncbi:hypothetical protein LWI29_001649 [Acer saccharum]|uniref:Uncharacterized protein n=1 Tax=Acer saccharum TaxID=4024 RepID=A0AA39W888_ACESA|nr:hypothetical protein LWI29_001649 [Acer saccharum]